MNKKGDEKRNLGLIKYIGFLVCFIVFIIFSVEFSVYADIYRYIDSKGVLHFTNVPTSSNYRLYIRENPAKNLSSYSINRYDNIIQKAAKRHGIDFPLLKSIIKVESGFNPQAVSKAGALGLMQLMPENVKSLNIKNPFDPLENIMGGTLYLKKMLKRFNGKLPLALAAYNAGPNVVERYNRIPHIKETENFVKKVMKQYYVFKR